MEALTSKRISSLCKYCLKSIFAMSGVSRIRVVKSRVKIFEIKFRDDLNFGQDHAVVKKLENLLPMML